MQITSLALTTRAWSGLGIGAVAGAASKHGGTQIEGQVDL